MCAGVEERQADESTANHSGLLPKCPQLSAVCAQDSTERQPRPSIERLEEFKYQAFSSEVRLQSSDYVGRFALRRNAVDEA